MQTATYKQIQDFATKTADLAVKKLGITETEADLVYNTVFTLLDWLNDYPSKDEQ